MPLDNSSLVSRYTCLHNDETGGPYGYSSGRGRVQAGMGDDSSLL